LPLGSADYAPTEAERQSEALDVVCEWLHAHHVD
jgi:hypothetical protein